MTSPFKRILVGKPIASSEEQHQRLGKPTALAVFASDAISSTAYATDPAADDLASLTLDLLVSEAGYQRHGLNLMLLFGEPEPEPEPEADPPPGAPPDPGAP